MIRYILYVYIRATVTPPGDQLSISGSDSENIKYAELIIVNVEIIPETGREVALTSTMPLTSLKTTLWPVCRPCGWLSMQVTTPGLSWRVQIQKEIKCFFGEDTVFCGLIFPKSTHRDGAHCHIYKFKKNVWSVQTTWVILWMKISLGSSPVGSDTSNSSPKSQNTRTQMPYASQPMNWKGHKVKLLIHRQKVWLIIDRLCVLHM